MIITVSISVHYSQNESTHVEHSPHCVDYSRIHPVPCIGESLSYVPKGHDPHYVGEPLPSALLQKYYDPNVQSGEGSAFLPFTTMREFSMVFWMNKVTDKPDWCKKVFDAEILTKWREELAMFEITEDDWPRAITLEVSDRMFEYCVAELQHIAEHVYPLRNDGALIVCNGNVVKSDKAVPEAVKLALQSAVELLESVPENEKDWRQGTNDVVLDVVDPSLFPLIYGRSRALPVGERVVGLGDCIGRCREGDMIGEPTTTTTIRRKLPGTLWHPRPYSSKFQWLPCEVDISGSDGAKYVSYINNLHPMKHADLYQVIEKVVDAAIPLWELALAPIFDKDFEYYQRIIFDAVEYTYPAGGGDGNDGSIGGENSSSRPILIQPEPEEFDVEQLKSPKPIDIRRLYGEKNRPLQVIVKLVNIELTPEKPKYEGGTWHVEGKQNEHICATAMYSYSSHNIKSPCLAFEHIVNGNSVKELWHEQGCHDFFADVFGCVDGKAVTQYAGQLEIFEGRLLTFPNILMNRMRPFALEDPSRNGHLKLLVLFLVDPNVRIASTANFPCQQFDWWREAVVAPDLSNPTTSNGLDMLPQELKDQICEFVDGFPIALAEARELRFRLIRERMEFTRANRRRLCYLNPSPVQQINS